MTRSQLKHVVSALATVLPPKAPADALLRGHFRAHRELGLRDRALIAETVYAVLRRLRSLETIAGTREPRCLALVALVRLCGYSPRDLTGAISDREAAWLSHAAHADLSVAPFAVRAELPDWIADHLAARLGEDEAMALAQALNEPAPLDLRVNTWLARRDEVLRELATDGIGAEATPFSPLGIRVRGKPALGEHPLFLAGKIEVQDEGSQIVGLLVAPRRRQTVADFCAGAGGKTLLMAAAMHSQGQVYAFDVSENRLAKFKPRLKRSGLTNVQTIRIDSERDPRLDRLLQRFDRVLVDAPCSGLGTLRRNPDLKWRQTPRDLDELVAKQRAILASAARLVKPGGRLVYATCSLLVEENEAIVDAFLATRSDFQILAAREVLAGERIEIDTGKYLHLDPRRHGTDGFFAAVLTAASAGSGR